jgi:hypothetical protein
MPSVAWVAYPWPSLRGWFCALPLSFFAFLFPSMARIEIAFAGAIPAGRRCRNGCLKGCFQALFGTLLLAGLPAAAAGTATTTTLAVTSGGSGVTTVASGSVVTLTATVMAGTTPVNPGPVKFCDATAAYCDDIHILGTAQLTKAGTATFKFRPGVGSHSYKAVFVATKSDAGSASATAALTVTGLYPTGTTIAPSGSPGNYTLTATVGGVGPLAPTGTVSFLDTSNSNAVLATATLGAGRSGLSFVNSSNPAVGVWPHSIAVGDFNGDGIPDLAAADQCGSRLNCQLGDFAGAVTVLLGNGDGTFTAASTSPATGDYSDFIAVGDFNGDGIPDLAVANYYSNSVTVLLGNGDGTFTATATSPATGGYPVSIAVGDFNGDGILDLAVSNESETVTVLLGNGDGTFTATATSPATGYAPLAIAVGDFNGDGILDLAVTNGDWNSTAGAVTILLGNGDGTFTATATSPATGYGPDAIAVGDFNGDGIPDLAVLNTCGINVTTCDSGTHAGSVTILLGNGDGTFTPAASPTTGINPWAIAVGDFNGDGIPDLAVANACGTDPTCSTYVGTVTILLGNGDGTFTATAASPASGFQAGSIAVGDFDGDGIPDLAVAYGSTTGNGAVTVLLTETQTATALASGVALPVVSGAHQVVASYPGDSDYDPSTSLPTILTGGASGATLTSPTPGSTLPGSSVTFTWSAGTGPTAYQLWLGTTGVGSQNLYNSGSTTATSANVTGLPTYGQTIYATLGSLIGGVWQYANYTYTEAGTPAALTSPKPGSVLPGSSVTFTWTAGTGPTAYQLWLGTTWRSSNLYNSGSTTATSASVTGLPTYGQTVYATLGSLIGGVWQYAYYTYTEAGTSAPAALTSPTPGSTLTGSSVTFAWSAGTSVTAYQLCLGTTGVGSCNLYDSGSTTATSAKVTGLPTLGQTIYATLGSEIGGVWQYANYTYTEAGAIPAALISPTPGSVLPGSSVTFTWSAGTGPTAYQLWLGTTGVGSQNLYNSGSTTATSANVTGLPTYGQTIYASLGSLIGGVWQYAYYTYTEAGTPVPAALTSPTPGSTLTGSSVTFAWTAGTGPTAYQLWLGTTGVGSQNLYNSGSTTATSASVTGLPTYGQKVYATLGSLIGGVWQYAYYTYTEAGTPAPASITSPAPGSTLPGSSVTFTWTAGGGPTAYQLWLGTTRVGSQNLYNSGATKATTVTVNSLPTDGVTLFARLWSLLNGTWQSIDYTYTEAGAFAPAALTSPTPGSTLPGSSVTFTWTGGSGPAAYQLWLGTTRVGSQNLYDSGATTATSETVTVPANGAKVYVRLWSEIDGSWQSADYTYTEARPAPGTLTFPQPGSTLTGSSATFTWTGGTGPTAYQLWLGTTRVGSQNLYDSGATKATTVTVNSLPTDGVTVFARLWSKINGTWQSIDYLYTESGTLATAALTSPTPGSTLTGSSVTFAWTGGSGPAAYELWLGTSRVGSQDLYDSGSTTATSETVTVPTNGVTVFARLWSEIDGSWRSTDYLYTESGTLAPAALTSPTPGSTLPGSSVTFTWTAGTGPAAYELWLGTTRVGSQNLYDSGATKATTVTVSDLPTNGVTVYARLWWEIDAVWKSADYTYTAQ